MKTYNSTRYIVNKFLVLFGLSVIFFYMGTYNSSATENIPKSYPAGYAGGTDVPPSDPFLQGLIRIRPLAVVLTTMKAELAQVVAEQILREREHSLAQEAYYQATLKAQVALAQRAPGEKDWQNDGPAELRLIIQAAQDALEVATEKTNITSLAVKSAAVVTKYVQEKYDAARDIYITALFEILN